MKQNDQEFAPVADKYTEVPGQASDPRKGKKPLSKTARLAYKIAGFFFVFCAFLGVILPVMPTTIFVILASAMFLKSSPKAYQWLHRSPIFGPYLQAHRDGTGLSTAYKVWTISFLWLGLMASGIFVVKVWWVRAILAVIGIAVTIHILTIKPRKRQEELDSVDPLEIPDPSPKTQLGTD